MKKPSWGLWLLVIVAPIAVFFTAKAQVKSPTYVPRTKLVFRPIAPQSSTATPGSQAYISNVMFSTDIDHPNKTSVSVFISNPTVMTLEIRPELVAGKLQFCDNGKMVLWAARSMNHGKFWVPFGTIKRWRKEDIHINIHWKLGKSKGTEDIVIAANKTAIGAK